MLLETLPGAWASLNPILQGLATGEGVFYIEAGFSTCSVQPLDIHRIVNTLESFKAVVVSFPCFSVSLLIIIMLFEVINKAHFSPLGTVE
jgi:hypothetical protein